jgi:hypothetical protein
MTQRAWIWDFVLIGHRRGNDLKCVGAHKNTGNGDLDFGHVASDALATRRIRFMMRVFFDCGRVRTVE